MASYKICFLDFCYKKQASSCTKHFLFLQNATQGDDFVKKVVFGCVWHYMVRRMCVEHLQKSAVGLSARLIGDDVAAGAGDDSVLAHAHLVVDGNARQGAAVSRERIEVRAASGAHCLEIVGVDR